MIPSQSYLAIELAHVEIDATNNIEIATVKAVPDHYSYPVRFRISFQKEYFISHL